MKRGLSRLTKHLFRRGEAGQTIVILAFGFIVLLAFVGIVTDVSLMFVRYSTLRRAIDAAAVSAAGQLRRAAPTKDEEDKAKTVDPVNWQRVANGYAYARNIASVNLAARQFIEMYGLDPTVVLVDTCATTRLPDGTYTDPQLECTAPEPRKLVRVTAQVNSPTVFLRLIGWGDVTLEATAISETAVMDVVMIFDVSESMLNQTTYDDWSQVPARLGPDTGSPTNQAIRYYPPRMSEYPADGSFGIDAASVTGLKYGGNYYAAWTDVLNKTQQDLNIDPSGDFLPRAFTVSGSGASMTVKEFPYTVTPPGYTLPRSECRVRFWPSAGAFRLPDGGNTAYTPAPNPYLDNNDVRAELTKFMNSQVGVTGDYAKKWDGFIPTYNYFGCCNDPNGDFMFYDLVCQPMQKVRTASKQFLDHIDFNRGDRVALVTFDRFAYLMDPDGTCPTCTNPPMMSSEDQAVSTMNRMVGVRADPSYYADTDNNGDWDHFVFGSVPYDPGDPKSKAILYKGTTPSFDETRLGALNYYPVYNNCYYQNATLGWPRSLYSSPPVLLDRFGNLDYSVVATGAALGIPYQISRDPTPLSAPSSLAVRAAAEASPPLAVPSTMMQPNLNNPVWNNQMPQVKQTDKDAVKPFYSYELRAECRGSNVGAALRTANNALLDPVTTRSNGAVWVMVMLGDGAAAGSDPVIRNGLGLSKPDPYNGFNNDNPEVKPQGGDYGFFGVCPYGEPLQRGALVDDLNGNKWSTGFPYCSDPLPETRHFCPFQTVNGRTVTDIGQAAYPDCSTSYDVDDFARDWADFVGLENPNSSTKVAQQLPTIFTIGFGLDFQAGAHTCADNPEDCLGEELLRYIADVGDNNRMDIDYEQDMLSNDKSVDGQLAPGQDWGPRGACEGPLLGGFTDPSQVLTGGGSLNDFLNPLPPKESCGNYFNAPDEIALKNVFDTIASRMFTRLTR